MREREKGLDTCMSGGCCCCGGDGSFRVAFGGG